ncbi:hypothetical protein AB0P37_08560 [Streptomyces antimycoticus]|uniref:hypothetical protein n=1 Tax=Streptomyces antimycoticus TaxID=68175 RepID=UPI00342C334F
MSPEILALVSGVASAAIMAGPSYLALSRARGAARAEGEATRETIHDAIGRSTELLTVQMAEVQRDVRRLEDWQTSHTAEHLLIRRENGGS